MQRTTRIKFCSTLRTRVAAREILVHGELPPTPPAEDRLCGPLTARPDLRLMAGERVVAADAGVVPSATLVLDGDHVAVGVPVDTLCYRGDVDAVDLRPRGRRGGLVRLLSGRAGVTGLRALSHGYMSSCAAMR